MEPIDWVVLIGASALKGFTQGMLQVQKEMPYNQRNPVAESLLGLVPVGCDYLSRVVTEDIC